jgi:membrane-bound inhibitor of C-type lysozyme
MRYLAILAAVAIAGTATAQDVPEGLTVTYTCAGGVQVLTAYINTPSGDAYAVILHDDALVPMKAGPTGSGVRYLSLDDTRLVWHTKGDGGFLARDDAGETMIVRDCVADR